MFLFNFIYYSILIEKQKYLLLCLIFSVHYTPSESDNGNGGNEEECDKPKKIDRSNWQGKYGFDDYKDANTSYLTPENFCSGDSCPHCCNGKLYNSEARKLLQFTGNAPITVNRYVKKTLRCNACDYIVMNNKNINKWTNSSRSAIVLQKTYGTPFIMD